MSTSSTQSPTVMSATGGVVLGIVGIAAALIWLAAFGMMPPGIAERVAVYAFMRWQLGFGGLSSARHPATAAPAIPGDRSR
ncbi:hypothetical protein [Nonomuraea sp. NPDC049028]|uniref:hypothetical protein n=1 Tax=Nonomuraea sp. NPDC049028 TaxID=3364348 RepID=UPI00371C4743